MKKTEEKKRSQSCETEAYIVISQQKRDQNAKRGGDGVGRFKGNVSDASD